MLSAANVDIEQLMEKLSLMATDNSEDNVSKSSIVIREIACPGKAAVVVEVKFLFYFFILAQKHKYTDWSLFVLFVFLFCLQDKQEFKPSHEMSIYQYGIYSTGQDFMGKLKVLVQNGDLNSMKISILAFIEENKKFPQYIHYYLSQLITKHGLPIDLENFELIKLERISREDFNSILKSAKTIGDLEIFGNGSKYGLSLPKIKKLDNKLLS